MDFPRELNTVQTQTEVLRQILAEVKKQGTHSAVDEYPAQPIGIIGGAVKDALPFVGGWSYVMTDKTDQVLLRGATPLVVAEWIDQEGYVLGGQVAFSDPDTRIRLTVDNLKIESSPRQMNLVTQIGLGAFVIMCHLYNPALNLYGVTVSARDVIPFRTRVFVEVFHPAAALSAASRLRIFQFTKVQVTNRKEFFEGIKRFEQQQSRGAYNVPLRTGG